MSDISQIKLGTTVYEIKDKVSRQNMINKNTDSDVNAVVNFLNGLKVGGHNVMSQATAEIASLPSGANPTVTISVDQSGIAHFSFGIPIPEDGASASFSENSLFLG